MMQARQGILFNFLKLHEEALAIDDAFEIDEALKIVEHEHIHHFIAKEIRFNIVTSIQQFHDAERLHQQLMRETLIN